MAELSGDLLKHFGRHLVSLECTYVVRHRNRPHQEVRNYYSGFILYTGGAYVWVTAGHCLVEIRAVHLANTDCFGNIRFQFIDTLHDAAVSDLPVPFDYVNEEFRAPYWHRDDSVGTASATTTASSSSAHITPVCWTQMGSSPWTSRIGQTSPTNSTVHYMLGLPGERISRDERGQSVVRPSMFSVAKLPQKPDRYREHVDPCSMRLSTRPRTSPRSRA